MTDEPAGDPVALVTGGARRLGAAIVRRLHAEGYRIAIHHRRSGDAAAALAGALEGARAGSARPFAADLLEPDAPADLVAGVVAVFDRLDLLVNNASTFYPTPLGTIDDDAWRDLVGTNLKAPLFLAQAAAPLLRRTRGSIVNVTDVNAERPLPGHAVYCVAKAGLVMLTRALARDLAPEIRVNAVAPGAILWPEPGPDAETRRAIVAGTPLGRAGDPADVAAAVLFLARDAPYTTGQVIAVDGGRLLRQ